MDLARLHVLLLEACFMWFTDGASALEMNHRVGAWCDRHSVRPAFKGFDGYQFNLCTSVDDAVIHGLPTGLSAADCRIFGCDVGITDGQTVLDAAWSACGRRATDEDRHLVATSFSSLRAALGACRPDENVGTVGAVTEREAQPYAVCRGWSGHGVGATLHEPPDVPLHGPPGGSTLETGMLLAVEPMLSAGSGRTIIDNDGWTVRSADGTMTSHQEAVVEVGAGVLTPWWERVPLERLLSYDFQ